MSTRDRSGLDQGPQRLKYDGEILNLHIRYKHLVIGNKVENDFIKSRNLLISYIKYAIYKFWVMSENGKINFNNDNLSCFVKKDIFRRSLYNKEQLFIQLCDKICTEL